MVNEFYTGLKLQEHVSKQQILKLAEFYMEAGKIQDAAFIITDFELFDSFDPLDLFMQMFELNDTR